MSSQPRWLRSFQRRNRRESARVQRRTCAVKFHHGPPTGNPGPSEVFRRGLPLLIADRHGDTHIVRNQADYDRITRETA